MGGGEGKDRVREGREGEARGGEREGSGRQSAHLAKASDGTQPSFLCSARCPEVLTDAVTRSAAQTSKSPSCPEVLCLDWGPESQDPQVHKLREPPP